MHDSASTAANPRIDIYFRYNATSGERIILRIRDDQAVLLDYDGSSATQLDIDTAADSDLDTWYTVRIVADGASVKVYKGEKGGTESLLFDETGVSLYNGSKIQFSAWDQTVAAFDNIRIIADDLETETTFTYASNNELSTMVDYNGTTTFSYDDWGRTTSKSRTASSHSATYGWGHNHKIVSVDSNFPDEGDVDYQYGGDGLRRQRDPEVGDSTWYNWNAGYTVINEEADDGTGVGDDALTRTYVGDFGDIAGSNPATGTARYYTHDHLGSTRGVFDASKTSLATFEFTPYGSSYHANGPADLTHLFTGHDLDPLTGNYFAPFRYLNPSAGRWMSQDPLRMISGPNMYGYVSNNPINLYDPLGLYEWGAFLCGFGGSLKDSLYASLNPTAPDAWDRSSIGQAWNNRNKYPFESYGALTGLGLAVGAMAWAAAEIGSFGALSRWFGRGRYFRAGRSSHEGGDYFRIAGEWVEKLTGKRKWPLKWLGRRDL